MTVTCLLEEASPTKIKLPHSGSFQRLSAMSTALGLRLANRWAPETAHPWNPAPVLPREQPHHPCVARDRFTSSWATREGSSPALASGAAWTSWKEDNLLGCPSYLCLLNKGPSEAPKWHVLQREVFQWVPAISEKSKGNALQSLLELPMWELVWKTTGLSPLLYLLWVVHPRHPSLLFKEALPCLPSTP